MSRPIVTAEELLFTTVRLEGHSADGDVVGTGFLYARNDRIFLVTNRHVVAGVQDGSFTVLSKKTDNALDLPDYGTGWSIPFSGSDFRAHPDSKIDVAVCNVSGPLNDLSLGRTPAFFRVIGDQHIPSTDRINRHFGPIEDVIIVGYPNGMWDRANIMPIARKGMTATPYYLNFEGSPTFLVDAAIFPGSSGSPVFLLRQGTYPDRQGTMYFGEQGFFLGLIASCFEIADGEFSFVDIPTLKLPVYLSRRSLNLGKVFKPHTVVETIEYYLSTGPNG